MASTSRWAQKCKVSFKTQVVVQYSKLADAVHAEDVKLYCKEALERLEKAL
ncbi:MAG: hypothetical protein V1724_05950 [Chloroflexota bacterium]